YLHLLHNTNCHNSIDKTASASAVDKAACAFFKLEERSFLPGKSTQEEIALFALLYSLYLVWEEPALNAGLTTGFIGEKFFKNAIQKNPETTKYLTPWLKKHPEVYLGLSKYRN